MPEVILIQDNARDVDTITDVEKAVINIVRKTPGCDEVDIVHQMGINKKKSMSLIRNLINKKIIVRKVYGAKHQFELLKNNQ